MKVNRRGTGNRKRERGREKAKRKGEESGRGRWEKRSLVREGGGERYRKRRERGRG